MKININPHQFTCGKQNQVTIFFSVTVPQCCNFNPSLLHVLLQVLTRFYWPRKIRDFILFVRYTII